MNDLPTSSGPWQLLLLDPDPADPKWLLCTICHPGDVRPAHLSDMAPDEVTAEWAANRGGLARVTFTPLHRALAWRVADER
jgi:hypothetical protein